IPRHLEVTEGPATLRVRLALRNPLPIKVSHLLNEIVVLQQDGTIWPNGERMLVAGDGDPGIGCCGFAVVLIHVTPPKMTLYTETRKSQNLRDSLFCHYWRGVWGSE